MRKLYLSFTLLFLFLPSFLSAQTQEATIQQHLEAHSTQLGLEPEDIEDWVITDSYESRHTGVTHVYIRQRYAQVEVFNGVANFNLKDGKVLSMGNRLVPHLKASTNSSSPKITPKEAIEYAASQLNLGAPSGLTLLETINDQQYRYSKGDISLDDIPVRLVYQPIPNGTVRLAWDLSISTTDTKNWWSVRIDAESGDLLEQHNWIVNCQFDYCANPTHNHVQTMGLPAPAKAMAPNTYNVFPIPVESPNHGVRGLVTNPADLTASPFGWHDTNGSSGAEFTITRGNNVWAQEDQNGNNGTGFSPDGGPTLDFDFTLNINQAPNGYVDVACVNLFYMSNIMHDIWYQYGFDEPAGNFQQNNYGRGGVGSDYVLADAQDGSGLNNANFGTPADGNRPRMQMFLWSAPTTSNLLTINSPTSLAGGYQAIEATFGPGLTATPITADLALADDNVGDNEDACETIINGASLSGKIVVIRRGSCAFTAKVKAAQDEGAVAVIMVNNVAGSPIAMGGTDGTITIPSVMVSQTDGEALITALQASTTINGTLQDPGGPFQIDGDFDNVIIAHEYGHGISNRLTGGPSNVNCLSNSEQMGEGWSDWFGLILTIEPGDLATDARGVGTFAIGEPTTGTGIRNAPYSTDLGVNPFTYAATNNTATISRPHGIGFVWCTMLWDLTWAFIDVYGYDSDVYSGTGGNNLAMQLIMDGMKLQPCSPGFVDGRDAILDADTNLTGGVNGCLIWNVFAARGLGFSASQGSSGSRTDQTEAFDLPPGVPAIGPCMASLLLPVEFTGFEALAVNNSRVLCKWTTASEQNNDYFTVERSHDGIHFEEAGRVSSKGNSSNAQSYSFFDEKPYGGVSYYRIRQTDKNGSYSHSNIETVKINGSGNDFVQVSPNPNGGTFNLSLDLGGDQYAEIEIRNMLGKLVEKRIVHPSMGVNLYEFDITEHPSGTYLITIKDEIGQRRFSQRIIKTR